MRRVKNDYADAAVRCRSEQPDPRFYDMDKSKKSFIMLPPWVADKIELSGFSLSNFFADLSWERQNEISPSISYINDVEFLKHQSQGGPFSEARERQLNKLAKTLSTEDVIDIGLWHYLFSEALHKLHKLNGLATEVENRFLIHQRNKSRSSSYNDGMTFTFGGVTIANKSHFEKGSSDYVVDYDQESLEATLLYGGAGPKFHFMPAPGVSHKTIVSTALNRIHGVLESGITDRVKRQGDVVSFSTVDSSTVIVPSLATVLNVATLLSPTGNGMDDGNVGNAAADPDMTRAIDTTIREQIVVFMEQILSELRRFSDNQEIARTGLFLIYSRLI